MDTNLLVVLRCVVAVKLNILAIMLVYHSAHSNMQLKRGSYAPKVLCTRSAHMSIVMPPRTPLTRTAPAPHIPT